MSRADKLKIVENRLRGYFQQNISVQDAHRLLENDPSVILVRLSKVEKFYTRFAQERKNMKAEQKRKQNRQKKRLSKEPQKNDERYKIWDGTFECDHSKNPCNARSSTSKWNERYSIGNIANDVNSEFHRFSLFDAFSDRSTTIEVEKSAQLVHQIFSVSNDYGILVETTQRGLLNSSGYYLSLICLDVETKQFKKLGIYQGDFVQPYVYVDSKNPTSFVVRWRNAQARLITFQRCKINDKYEIEFGEIHEISPSTCYSYYRRRVYSLKLGGLAYNSSLSGMKIRIFNLETGMVESFELESLPENTCFKQIQGARIGGWARDQLFMQIKFKICNAFGIARTDASSKEWTILKFSVSLPILHMRFVNDNDLLVHTQDVNSEAVEGKHHIRRALYRIPLRKPSSLRSVAWLSLVRLARKKNYSDPYAFARQWLPLNSDIYHSF